MKCGQLIAYNMRNIFLKDYIHNTHNVVDKLFPGSYLKKQD